MSARRGGHFHKEAGDEGNDKPQSRMKARDGRDGASQRFAGRKFVGAACLAVAGGYALLLIAAATWSAGNLQRALSDGLSLFGAASAFALLLALFPIGAGLALRGRARVAALCVCAVAGAAGLATNVIAAFSIAGSDGRPFVLGTAGPQGAVLTASLLALVWLLAGLAVVGAACILSRTRARKGRFGGEGSLGRRAGGRGAAALVSLASVAGCAGVVACCVPSLPFAAATTDAEQLVFLEDGLYGRSGATSVVCEEIDVLCNSAGEVITANELEPGDIVAASVFMGSSTDEYPGHIHVRWGFVLRSCGAAAVDPFRGELEKYGKGRLGAGAEDAQSGAEDEEYPGQSQGYVGPNGEGVIDPDDYASEEEYLSALIAEGGKQAEVPNEEVDSSGDGSYGYYKGRITVYFYRSYGEDRAREIIEEAGGVWVSDTFAWKSTGAEDDASVEAYFPEAPYEDQLQPIIDGLEALPEVSTAFTNGWFVNLA